MRLPDLRQATENKEDQGHKKEKQQTGPLLAVR